MCSNFSLAMETLKRSGLDRTAYLSQTRIGVSPGPFHLLSVDTVAQIHALMSWG